MKILFFILFTLLNSLSALATESTTPSNSILCRNLAGFGDKGFLISRVQPEAITICEKAVAEQPDNLELRAYLARAYYSHEANAVKAKAFQPAQYAAEHGNTLGMAVLGVLYEFGYGVKKDLKQAAEWYKRGAEAGNAWAALNYGNALLNRYYGAEKAPDEEDVEKWYLKAKAQGYGQAHGYLARLYQKQKRNHEAVPLYKAAIEYSKTQNGEESKEIGVLYIGLAYVLNEDQYGENYEPDVNASRLMSASVEAYYKQGLSILQKALGPDDPLVAATLKQLGDFYRIESRTAEAEVAYSRILSISDNAPGAMSSNLIVDILRCLDEVYLKLDRFHDLVRVRQRTLDLHEKELGLIHPKLVHDLEMLGSAYAFDGQFEEATRFFWRAVSVGEKNPDTALETLNNFQFHLRGHLQPGDVLEISKRIDQLSRKEEEAKLLAASISKLEPVLKDVFWKIQEEKLIEALRNTISLSGTKSVRLAYDLSKLADLYYGKEYFPQAEELYKRSLYIYGVLLETDNDKFFQLLKKLAMLYEAQGRTDEATPLYERRLRLAQKSGSNSKRTFDALYDLARVYIAEAHYEKAEELLKQRQVVAEQLDAPTGYHVQSAYSLGDLGELYYKQMRYEEAGSLLKKSQLLLEQSLELQAKNGDGTGDCLECGIAYGGVIRAQVLSSLGHQAEAEALAKKSVETYAKKYSMSDYRHWANAELAKIYTKQGKYSEAETIFKEYVTFLEDEDYGYNLLTYGYLQLADFYLEQGRPLDALHYSHQAYALLKKHFLEADVGKGGEFSTVGRESEQKSNREKFTTHIGILSKQSELANFTSESFEAMQLSKSSTVGKSVAQMAARYATGGGEMATAIRLRQDTADEMREIDKQLLEASRQTSEKRNAERETNLRKRLTDLEASLQQQTEHIAKRFPEYDALVSPAPISAVDAQKLVKHDEALLAYIVADKQSYAWVVRPDATYFIPLDVDSATLEKQVSKLRSRLDPEQNPEVEAFDTNTAYAIYQKLVAPLEGKLKGVHHIIQVNDGALQSLPFPVLVDKPVEEGKPTSWLSDRYAFSVLPSVSSLRALHTFARATPGKNPFAGFGNPVLNGDPGQQRRLTSRALFTRGVTVGNGSLRNGIADVEAIRKASPLPDTETELKSFAQTLNAQPNSVIVQQRATETAVKQTDLTQYNVLAFATHGVMAGELSGVAEPGLILTPPKEGTELDDGYLSASEVAQLKLNADWVILSACNTAAPDGKSGAEGLTGLAKGFFHAGARTLLVSNWYVVSDAATQLTTDMFKRYQASPKLGKAEALRESMQALRQNPKFNHPLYWAPFSVVGEGM